MRQSPLQSKKRREGGTDGAAQNACKMKMQADEGGREAQRAKEE
jgi:hypothetical protein